MAGHAFLSYSNEDAAYVQRLAEFLAGQGLPVWYDSGIGPGQRFDQIIAQKIENSAAVVVIVTPASMRSAWVAREISYAIEKYKPLVLLMLQRCETPLALAGIHYDDVTDGSMPSTSFVAGLRALVDPSVVEETPRHGWLLAGPEGLHAARSHFLRRGRGQRTYARDGDLFRGRVAAVAAVKGWLTAADAPGLVLVVTGQPGAGKSAVVARAALELAEVESSGLAFHARDATLVDFLRAMAAFIGEPAVDSIASLVDVLRRPGSPPCRVVVDALDEAGEGDRRRLVEALVEVAGLPQARVVAATRSLTGGNRFAPGTVLRSLRVGSADSRNLVDLDSDTYFDGGGLRDFITAVLCQEDATVPTPPWGAWAAYRREPGLRDRLARAVAQRAGRNYLVAALTSDSLSQADDPVDPAVAGFDSGGLPGTVGEALEKYLDRLPKPERNRVRGLLTALAYARGSGVDDALWLAFAERLGHQAVVADLDELRGSAAADYLLYTSGRRRQAPVTCLFHQALADELLAERDREYDERRILDALVPAPSAHAAADRAEPPAAYVRRYLATHAAAGGALDDAHVPGHFLPWETSGNIRALLGQPAPSGPAHRRLAAWAAIEPYLGSADQEMRAQSLEFAMHALASADQRTGTHVPGLISPQWAHWTVANNVLAHLPDRVAIRAIAAFPGPDGSTYLAAGCRDGAVRIWDAATGERVGPVLTAGGDDADVWAVTAFAVEDGRWLVAAGGANQVVRVWDAETGTQVTSLEGHTGSVRGLTAFRAADGRAMLATASADKTVRIWDVAAGGPVGQPLEGHTESVRAVTAFAGADGAVLLASGGLDQTVRIWNPVDGTQVGEPLTGHVGWVRAVLTVTTHSGQTLLAAGDEGHIRLWDPLTRQPVGTPWTLPVGKVTALTTIRAEDDRILLVSAGSDRRVRAWDLASGEAVGTPKIGHTDWVVSLAPVANPEGRALVASAGGVDGTVRIWDVTHPGPRSATGDLGWMRDVVLYRDPDRGLLLATGSGDGRIRLWDSATGAQVRDTKSGHDGWVRAIALSHRLDGQAVLVTSGSDATVRRWDAASLAPIGEPLLGHTESVWAMTAFAGLDGRGLVATGGNDHEIRIWDVEAGSLVIVLTGHTGGIRALTTCRAADGRTLLVSASADKTVRLWDIPSGSPVGEPLTGHTAGVRAVAAFEVDGEPRLVSSGCDRVARIWDPVAGTQLGDALVGHASWVIAVATVTHTCGRSLVITSGDQSLRVWDPVAGQELTRLVVGAPVQKMAVWLDPDAHVAVLGVAGVAVLRLALGDLCPC